ncbi:hypothetical protein I3760_10G016800 [Carya illinoinensis]|nr:hypothetical protein I3760_10G016800 [Carya illinoinensis]KAG2683093.1 hypothetical protein I3760_10G016800 [Carya illinoinensis]KAG2683096.1 hypothetical protein I3760_10G016800 [Carya illinoinensis]KAG2683097.1 hypothetical protein I3760_10G016800 [Carya illinoinensis]KAG2683098.1 hypothetical protein I3760_10G016800 [Carya illinoinensis]
MTRSSASSKKQQKRGVDFKKIKRKIGRKLPPPKNATNTEIKSKAIILPEQSVASEKQGLAVNKKGLTLKELLQQTSHHNPKVRRDALLGIRDLFLKHPAELTLHKYAVIEKLRERISDDDKMVRETLYQLFKSVIFPSCKQDNQGLFTSLIMAYIFNAMTHLSIDIRLMAFKFLDLAVENHSPSFLLYAEKILQSYGDILRKNQFYLHDKGKLKNVLAGLMRCLSLVPCNKREVDSCENNDAGQGMLHAFEPDMPVESAGLPLIVEKLKDLVPILVNCFQDFISLVHTMPLLDVQSFDCLVGILQSIDIAVRSFIYGTSKGKSEYELSHGESDVTVRDEAISSLLMKKVLVVFPLSPAHQLSEKDVDRYFIFNVLITGILLQFSEWICPPADVLEKFLEFIENALLGKICSGTRFGKAVWEKHFLSLLPFFPKLLLQVVSNWRSRLLQAFTKTFRDCHPESSLKLACLSTIEDMLIPKEDGPCLDASDPEILGHQIAWIRELSPLLILLGDKNPYCSQVVLRLQLRLGQCALVNSSFAWEYENMQYSLLEFYSTCRDDGDIYYGPFIGLPKDSQELSLCSLYYFSNLDSPLLRSIASCCLCPDLEPFILFRIVEVLHSAYTAGHIKITDHISFFITLLSRFKVFPENIYPVIQSDTEIGNRGTYKSVTSVVCSNLSQMGDSSLVFQMVEKVILGQMLLKPSLDNACAMLRMLAILDSKPTRLSEQSINTLSNFLSGYLIDVVHCIPEDHDEPNVSIPILRYYLLPCFFLFDRSHKLLDLVLRMMGSLITESSSPLFSPDYIRYATDSSSRTNAIVSVIVLMHRDVKVHKILSELKAETRNLLQKMLSLQSSEEINMTIEERHKIRRAFDKLKALTSANGLPAS